MFPPRSRAYRDDTSAGVVLAGTFASLAALPLIGFTELGCVIALGVLLDTLMVRTVLVPALVLTVERRIWWPVGLLRHGHHPVFASARKRSVSRARVVTRSSPG